MYWVVSRQKETRNSILTECQYLLKNKNAQYRSDRSRFANFQTGAEITDMPIVSVAFGYQLKHLAAIISSHEIRREYITDALNYCVIILFFLTCGKDREDEFDEFSGDFFSRLKTAETGGINSDLVNLIKRFSATDIENTPSLVNIFEEMSLRLIRIAEERL